MLNRNRVIIWPVSIGNVGTSGREKSLLPLRPPRLSKRLPMNPSYKYETLRMRLLRISLPNWFGFLPPKLHLVPKPPRPRRVPATTERPPYRCGTGELPPNSYDSID